MNRQKRTASIKAEILISAHKNYRLASANQILSGSVTAPIKIDDRAYINASNLQSADLERINGVTYYRRGSGYHYDRKYDVIF